jgi:hypothetical protein
MIMAMVIVDVFVIVMLEVMIVVIKMFITL